MFKKILIANRGEIALRVQRACREMGIKAVMVYSEADRDAKYVRLADEAVCIGPANSAQSYLNMPAIISAAEVTDAEAIHPGYGFLSENADFAEAVATAGIVWIGPKPSSIRAMGLKDAAKKLMAEAGYPEGFEIQMNCPNNRYVNDEEICQNLVSMWARIGVKTKLATEGMATFIQKVQNFDTSAYLLGWGVATFDAQYSLQSLVRTRSSGADGNFNFLKISNAKVDALTEAMKTEMDKTKRDNMLKEALTITRDEALYVPLHHQMRPWAMKKNVSIAHNSNDAPKMYYATVGK
mgnify:CR=1 FL=1